MLTTVKMGERQQIRKVLEALDPMRLVHEMANPRTFEMEELLTEGGTIGLPRRRTVCGLMAGPTDPALTTSTGKGVTCPDCLDG